MITETLVKFETDERRLLAHKLLPNIGVGRTDGQLEEATRRVRHLASGDFIPADKLDEGIRIVTTTYDACVEQGDPAWWLANVARPGPSGADFNAGGTALIANPEQFAQDMAANRMSQARDVMLTLTMLMQARALAGRVGVEEED